LIAAPGVRGRLTPARAHFGWGIAAQIPAALAVALTLFGGTAAKCEGAAARDPEKPCANPTKRVRPTPDQALITPNVACARGDVADSCSYGPADPVATVALLGDSHAAHWRAGMEVVARAKRWRVVEFARPHCPFSEAAPARSEGDAAACAAFNRGVVEWLAANPSVTTVFVSNNARLAMAEKGLDYKVDGARRALQGLPASVTRVVVLRDTPTVFLGTPDCIRRAVRRKRAPGRQCAVPRKRALVTDGTAVAAERLGRDVIDLTPFFCDAKVCFPVIGGVLVHKDRDHLTQTFSATLGPYIARAFDGAG
jgi:hypothetical protein